MPREQSDNRKRSREIFDEHDGDISNREIAGILGCSEKSISGWKYKDNWLGKERSTPNEKNGVLQKKEEVNQVTRMLLDLLKNQHARKRGC